MLHATSRLPVLAARASFMLAASLAWAAGARAQITPTPSPIQRPPPTLRPGLPTLAAADLVIDKVQIGQVPGVSLKAVAFVTVRNAGSLAAVFHQGAVVVSGAAVDARGMRFPALVAQADFTLSPGQSQIFVLHSQDACTAGWGPYPVSFQVNPGGAVQEAQRTNNTSILTPGVADLIASDLVVSNLRLGAGRDPRDGRSSAMLLVVTARNNGSGPALLCPGMTLARQTASPVAGKYGLQSVLYNEPPPPPPDPPTAYTNPNSVRQTDYLLPVSSIVIAPGATQDFSMLAFKENDLQPGMYEWKAKVNPDASARESNTGNNEGSAQFPIQ